MDFYQVLEKRRTVRDFSEKEVSDELLKDFECCFKSADK